MNISCHRNVQVLYSFCYTYMLLSIHFVKYNKTIQSLNIIVKDYNKGSNDMFMMKCFMIQKQHFYQNYDM